jgi:formamidopyrimidine-DNA glycosylase
MPELPEVETTRRGIEPYIVGNKVVQVIVRQPKLRWPVSEELGQCLTGRRVLSVGRRAKYLFLETDIGKVMVHLGMSGSLRILQSSAEEGKHDHVDIVFENGCVLRFRDPRRFGSVFWLDGDEHWLLQKLGPEPLSDEFSADYLHGLSRRRKVAVKLFIMNAQVVVGVGNIYANEALYEAGIRPGTAAGRISGQRYGLLVNAIKQVLCSAIDAGGTTLRDFVREDGSPGYFQQVLSVYGRGSQPCRRCQAVLKEIRQGGRSTVYCPSCQQ